MRSVLLLLVTLGSILGADPEAIQKKVTALVHSADQAAASDRVGEAEEGYNAALVQCDLLPPERYHCQTDVLWSLGRFYSQAGNLVKSEAAYKERLDILVAHQKPATRPDLDIGIALFDLQSVLSDSDDISRDADETGYMIKARRFYDQCKAEFPELRSICERRLADVEGLHGSLLTLRRRFDEAIPFLKAVIDRPDDGVRKETLVAALSGYATILIAKGKAAEAQEFIRRAVRLRDVRQ